MKVHEYEMERRKEQLRNQIDAIGKILRFDDKEVLTSEIRERLKTIRVKSEKLRHKLESGEFEIAIVGLEKAGKSSFANALMGNDILPSDEERCTYTTTSIRAGTKGENEAKVEFFDTETFDRSFRDKLQLMGVKEWDAMHFSQTTLEAYQAAYESLDETTQSMYREQNRDLTEILSEPNKRIIEEHLDRAPLSFSGDEELRSQDFKRYICKPGFAHAVREVTVKSSRLKDMPEAVIYDVPGLNSPTQIHKDQTREKMLQADAIVLITLADQPSFPDSLVNNIFNPRKDASREIDEDGLLLEEKLFVFANKADRAINLSKNMQIIQSELEKYSSINWGRRSHRILYGSSKAHLEEIGAIDGIEAMNALRQRELNDGIEEIHRRLKNYYDNERFHIMEVRVERMERCLREIFQEILSDERDAFSTGEQERIVTVTLDRARKKAREDLEQYRSRLIADYSGNNRPLTHKLSTDVAEKIKPEILDVTQEELDAEMNKYASVSQIQLSTAVDVRLRAKKKDEVFDAFHDYVTTFAADKHNECEQCLVDIIEHSLSGWDDGSPNPALTQAIRAYVEQRRAGRFDGRSYNGYYDSLVSRFTVDLFELLLDIPFGDDDRWKKWRTDEGVFFSLAMFAPNKNLRETSDRQPFHYLLLFHNPEPKLVSPKIEEVVKQMTRYLLTFLGDDKLSDKVAKMVETLAAARPEDALTLLQQKLSVPMNVSRIKPPQPHDKYEKVEKALQELTAGQGARTDLYLDLSTYRSFFRNRTQKTPGVVREEINEDIRILQVVLRDVAIPAICMEKVFLDLETRTIRNLLNSLDDDFRDFVASHIRLIANERYRALDNERKKRIIRANIRAEIKDALSEFYTSFQVFETK